MPRDGSGDFTRSEGPYVNGEVAEAGEINNELDDIASALSDSINRAGTKAMAANLPMGGNKVTGLAAASANGDAVRYEQLTALSSVYEAKDADLSAIAALGYTSGTEIIRKTAANTWEIVSDALYAHLAGAETITGLKTFNVGLFGQRLNNGNYIVFGSSGSRSLIAGNNGGAEWNWYIYSTVDAFERNVMQCALTTGVLNFTSNPTAGGVAIRVAGKTAVPIPASAMVPNTTNGAAPGTSESSTNKVMSRTLDFDQTTQEGAQFEIIMPKGWNESTVTFQPVWTAASGSGGVVWELRAQAQGDDDALDGSWGTGQTSTDTLIATGDRHIGPESSAITIGGSPAEGDTVVFQIRRAPSDGSDTLNADAKLLGIRLFVTTNAANDA